MPFKIEDIGRENLENLFLAQQRSKKKIKLLNVWNKFFNKGKSFQWIVKKEILIILLYSPLSSYFFSKYNIWSL